MNIGIISYDIYPFEGGMGKHIYDLYYENLAKKYDILFFSPCKNNLKNHYTISHLTKKIGKNILFSIIVNLKLKRLIKKYNLSKIHIHCGPGGIFLLRKIKKNKIISIFHHTYWQQKEYIKNQRWKRIFCIFEKLTAKKVDIIVAVSLDTKNIFVQNYNIHKEKIIVIPNAINTDNFYPIMKIKKIPNSILYLGRLDERKGVRFLIETFLSLNKNNPEYNLYIIGKGPDSKFIEDLILQKNLSNLHLLGFIPEEEKNKWLNLVQCLVIPSIFEGFGIIAIEAMAAGTPVIGTNVDGLRTVIIDDINGFLVDYNDVIGLENKIKYVINQDNSRIIENAIEVVRNEYSIQAVIKQIEESGIL